ncbi:hypothetical protein C9374_004326 [Naegleria lovaniensis]|uniref:Uncharacterized protein n=1 Tax=Naegleria lovaniensis TaxID=51637 RepID=A0AA88GT51_NAELO|nr:uncharacterized protein C9374_004326 [Naegleria lovaniensis]KAG2383655.1 hypothetical protein C9374_004326 [Naegleria lovaniensis]
MLSRFGYPIRVQIEYAFNGVRNCNDYTGKQTIYMNGDEVFDIYSAESMETKLQVMSDKLTDMERNIFYIENSNLLYEGVFGQDQKFEVNYDNLVHTILLKFFNPNFFIRRERHYLEGIDFITYENVKTTLYYNSIFTN